MLFHIIELEKWEFLECSWVRFLTQPNLSKSNADLTNPNLTFNYFLIFLNICKYLKLIIIT